MSPAVTVDPAPASERALIEGLLQFYIYDFAEMYGPDDGFDLGADGRYEPYPYVASYWRDADRWPLIIRCGGKPAGFILLNTVSHRGVAIDRAVAEFFVMRTYRRAGVGAFAARSVFTRYPGRWELAIAAPNAGARRFWPNVVNGTPGVWDVQTVDLDEIHQSRRIISFTSG